jgi:hypothetical protein
VLEGSCPSQADVRALLCGERAVNGGMEMLQYVRELGCVFDERTTSAAANQGNLEALRYLHMTGVPWKSCTLVAAVRANSLACLAYAHMHGCPQEGLQEYWRFHDAQTRSLPILRYVCEHFDPALAARVLEDTADYLSHHVVFLRRVYEQWENGVDWPLVLYLGKKQGVVLPKALADARATWMERAAALAGVFWKAKKQLCAEETRLLRMEVARGEGSSKITHADAERRALWDAMAQLPKELQELIAMKAEIIVL